MQCTCINLIGSKQKSKLFHRFFFFCMASGTAVAVDFAEDGIINVQVGSRVRKEFEDGWYNGEVTSINIHIGNGKALYRVLYEDGDEEDMYVEDVRDVLVRDESDTEATSDEEEYNMNTPLILRVPRSPRPHYRPMRIPEEDRHDAVFCLPGDRTTGDRRASLDCNIEDVVLVLTQTFLPDDFIAKVTVTTRAYAADNLQPLRQRNIGPADMLHFFALYYYFGIIKLPAKADYWHNDCDDFDILPESYPIATDRGMTRDRFNYIFRYIHATFKSEDAEDETETEDAEDETDDNDAVRDPVTARRVERWAKKVAPFLDLLRDASRKICVRPAWTCSIDEMMSRFKGRSSETFRMRHKPIKCGFKFYALACSQTGYVYAMHEHGRGSSEVGTIGSVVALAKQLPDRDTHRYVIAMDNFFTFGRTLQVFIIVYNPIMLCIIVHNPIICIICRAGTPRPWCGGIWHSARQTWLASCNDAGRGRHEVQLIVSHAGRKIRQFSYAMDRQRPRLPCLHMARAARNL